MREQDTGERDRIDFYYTYIYNGKRESCEGVELVGVLVAETIHPACMCEGGGRGGDRGGRAFYYTYIYNGKRESCETAFLAMPQNTID